MRQLTPVSDDRVLVSSNTSDDAAVFSYTSENGRALVQSIDFFTPIVDDPYQFGAIAAANSMSDIYAMGGKPLFALNVVCFPKELPMDMLAQILKGGADKAMEAGVPIVGGHTVDDPEPKYGLCVTGEIRTDRILTNATAKAGDLLVLTKPLGMGIIITATKRGMASPELIAKAVRIMSTLNRDAAEAMEDLDVNACTDVTGFGLLGHLNEMVKASGVGATLHLERVPVIEEVWELAEKGVVPGGTRNNLDFVGNEVVWEDRFTEAEKLILADAQTSGGLLISLPESESRKLIERLEKAPTWSHSIVGHISEDSSRRIQVARR